MSSPHTAPHELCHEHWLLTRSCIAWLRMHSKLSIRSSSRWHARHFWKYRCARTAPEEHWHDTTSCIAWLRMLSELGVRSTSRWLALPLTNTNNKYIFILFHDKFYEIKQDTWLGFLIRTYLTNEVPPTLLHMSSGMSTGFWWDYASHGFGCTQNFVSDQAAGGMHGIFENIDMPALLQKSTGMRQLHASHRSGCS